MYGSVFTIPYRHIFNSVLVSFAAATVITLASTPVSHLIVRKTPAWYGLIQKSSYIGYAMPGVVIGLALIFFGSRHLGSYYQTLPLLVFAYARSAITRLLTVSEELGDLQAMISRFSEHVRSVYSLEMFYGDDTLEGLINHSKELLSNVQEFYENFSLDDEEDAEDAS